MQTILNFFFSFFFSYENLRCFSQNISEIYEANYKIMELSKQDAKQAFIKCFDKSTPYIQDSEYAESIYASYAIAIEIISENFYANVYCNR